jgi:hypothetical protein
MHSAFININIQEKHVTTLNYGEKGHIQHSWNPTVDDTYVNNVNQKIIEFYYQLIRNANPTRLTLAYQSILSILFKNKEHLEPYRSEILLLCKLIAHTRDIIAGKGEQQLAFMQIVEIYRYSPAISAFLFSSFLHVKYNNKEIHPYGSMKDIKYFLKYLHDLTTVHNSNSDMYSYFQNYIFKICKNILERDEALMADSKTFSLFAKWFPRESSAKFGFIFKNFAVSLYHPYRRNNTSQKLSYTTFYMLLRKRLVLLNKTLNTTQINMCSPQKNWHNIDFTSITSQTLYKNNLAFLNLTKLKIPRTTQLHRKICATNLNIHVTKATSSFHLSNPLIKINARRCNVYELVRSAFNANTSYECDLINLQWLENSKNNSGLQNVIPIVDVSWSMERDNSIPLFNAIGMGIRVAEKNNGPFANRMLTFETNPHWIVLEDHLLFHQKVHLVKNSSYGGSTNIYNAFKTILDVIIHHNIHPTTVEHMTLAIFSDMQFNSATNIRPHTPQTVFFDTIKTMYAEAGLLSSFRCPYKLPHILFWNLRTTQGSPCIYNQPNVSMISGYSSSLLNAFSQKGLKTLSPSRTPISIFKELLANPRYDFIKQGLATLL